MTESCFIDVDALINRMTDLGSLCEMQPSNEETQLMNDYLKRTAEAQQKSQPTTVSRTRRSKPKLQVKAVADFANKSFDKSPGIREARNGSRDQSGGGGIFFKL